MTDLLPIQENKHRRGLRESLRVTWLLMDEDEYAIETTADSSAALRNDKQRDKQR
jgi:hypothetical protein